MTVELYRVFDSKVRVKINDKPKRSLENTVFRSVGNLCRTKEVADSVNKSNDCRL